MYLIPKLFVLYMYLCFGYYVIFHSLYTVYVITGIGEKIFGSR